LYCFQFLELIDREFDLNSRHIKLGQSFDLRLYLGRSY